MGRNLDRLPAGPLELPNDGGETLRRLPKIVMRYHHARRKKRALHFAPREVLRRFNFDIAPAAPGANCLRQNLNL